MLSLLLAATLVAAPVEKTKPIPTLTKAPTIDGDLKDLSPSFEPKLPTSAKGTSASLALKTAYFKEALHLGVTVTDDHLGEDDTLDVTLFFPESGTTSRGFVYRFGTEGLRASPAEAGPPEWASKLVHAATRKGDKGWTLEASIPARALPRFQGVKPLMVSVCVDYSDADTSGDPQKLSSCPTGDMPTGPLRLPDELRKPLNPPADVEGVEAQETGWLGFSKLHYPNWAMSLKSDTLTYDSLVALVAPGKDLDAKSMSIPLPELLVLPDNRPLLTVLTGKNPYLKDQCIGGNELRVALYAITGNAARRVLEWPVATCSLGRAMRFELTAEGSLVIGYTNGSTAQFTWTDDHFERSELGRRD